MRTFGNYNNVFMGVYESLLRTMKECDMENDVKGFKEQVDLMLERTTPSIMFYGIYNAGKSSIINAIFGEYIAEVGDIPTTQATQTIRWKGFDLVDTPGIDANDEHTQIAKNEIMKNDIILFVMDDMGSFEKKVVYKAIIEIVRMRKPLILVINQKQADEGRITEQENIKRIKERIIENLNREAKAQGINDITRENLYIIPVNADTAYESHRSEGEFAEILYDESGMISLETAMESELKRSDGIKMFIPTIEIVQQEIKRCQEKVKSKISDETEKDLYNCIDEIKKQKRSVYNTLIMKGRNEIMSFGDVISAKLRSGNSIEGESEKLNEKLMNIIQNTLSEAKAGITNNVKLYTVNIDGKQDIINSNVVFDESVLENIEFEKTGKNNLAELIDSIPVPPIIIPDGPMPLILYTIKGLASLFISKEKTQSNIDEIKERINAENNRVQEELNRKISAIYEINNSIRTEISKVEESFSLICEEISDKTYEDAINKLEEEYAHKNKENDFNKSVLDKLNDHNLQLEKLKLQIS